KLNLYCFERTGLQSRRLHRSCNTALAAEGVVNVCSDLRTDAPSGEETQVTEWDGKQNKSGPGGQPSPGPAFGGPNGAPSPEAVSVEIYDQIYNLRGSDAEYIQLFAALVNSKMGVVAAFFFFFKQKTAYEIFRGQVLRIRVCVIG